MLGQNREAPVLFKEACSSPAADFARRPASEGAPTDSANLTPVCSVSETGGTGSVNMKTAPLSPIACLNKPLARGEAICALTDMEPADSPKMVTLPGSPPKATMFLCTHC